MAKAEIIAYHGWGFDAGCWDAWKQFIPGEVTFRLFNRGYFDEADDPEFSREADSRIVFTHSFGLHLCPSEILSQTDLLVITGGFLSFHPRAARFRRRSRLVMKQMISRFGKKPHQVLKDFYKNVFHPQEGWDPPQSSLNRDLLLDDLIRLNEQEIALKRLNKIPKVCILHGSADAIVPRAKGRELYDELQPKARYLEVKETGHALPFTAVEQCWSFIKPEVARLL